MIPFFENLNLIRSIAKSFSSFAPQIMHLPSKDIAFTKDQIEKIGNTSAHMTAGFNNYDFKDDNFLDGYIFYRLKMVDADGKFSRSNIIRVYSGTKNSKELTVSPNPFTNEFLFGAVFDHAGKITIRIIDGKGIVVKTIKKTVESGFNSFQLAKLENISKGIYFLEVIQDSNSRKIKLIKE